jgi:hypothetical protein
MGAPEAMPWSRDEFEQRLRAKGKRYHIYHPYQVAMNSGKLTKEQIQGWVYNRYYYQISIPIKDAAVLSNMPDRDQRRQWIQRIIDHDGTQGDEGGIEAWIWLGQACGLKRDEVTSLKYVLPGVRFAVDAYVNFARRTPWQEAACSSLTEWIERLFEQRQLLQMGHAQRKEDLNLGLGWLYYALGRVTRPSKAVVIGSYRGFVPLVIAKALADKGLQIFPGNSGKALLGTVGVAAVGCRRAGGSSNIIAAI